MDQAERAPRRTVLEIACGPDRAMDALHKRRCAVGAARFYEWKRTDKRTKFPYPIGLKNGATSFIGACSKQPPSTAPTPSRCSPPAQTPRCSPSATAFLSFCAGRTCGDGSSQVRSRLRGRGKICQPFDTAEMVAWPVSSLVNSATNDVPACAQPVAEPPLPLKDYCLFGHAPGRRSATSRLTDPCGPAGPVQCGTASSILAPCSPSPSSLLCSRSWSPPIPTEVAA